MQPMPDKVAERLKKAELKRLIKQAAGGDTEAAKQLIGPFIADDEELITHGITAEFGLIKTYDFVFLTNKRMGDLEITPLTGNLTVEIAYLERVDAIVISQPAFPLLLRLAIWLSYPIVPVVTFLFMQSFFLAYDLELFSWVAGGMGAAVALFVLHRAFIPSVRRIFLRFKKSGIWLKLYGHPVGVLVFADRNRFAMLTSLARMVSELRSRLRTEAD